MTGIRGFAHTCLFVGVGLPTMQIFTIHMALPSIRVHMAILGCAFGNGRYQMSWPMLASLGAGRWHGKCVALLRQF